MDPVQEFSEIALREIYLHVDAAIGGFVLPFMRELGYEVPPFDLSLPGVTSITADAHKMGMVSLPASFLILKNKTLLNAGRTITSTKSGGSAAAARALFNHLAKRVTWSMLKALSVTRVLAEGMRHIDGLRLVTKSFVTIVGMILLLRGGRPP